MLFIQQILHAKVVVTLGREVNDPNKRPCYCSIHVYACESELPFWVETNRCRGFFFYL
jgi:hypothetical protein